MRVVLMVHDLHTLSYSIVFSMPTGKPRNEIGSIRQLALYPMHSDWYGDYPTARSSLNAFRCAFSVNDNSRNRHRVSDETDLIGECNYPRNSKYTADNNGNEHEYYLLTARAYMQLWRAPYALM